MIHGCYHTVGIRYVQRTVHTCTVNTAYVTKSGRRTGGIILASLQAETAVRDVKNDNVVERGKDRCPPSNHLGCSSTSKHISRSARSTKSLVQCVSASCMDIPTQTLVLSLRRRGQPIADNHKDAVMAVVCAGLQGRPLCLPCFSNFYTFSIIDSHACRNVLIDSARAQPRTEHGL
jgi:hypothetical protein